MTEREGKTPVGFIGLETMGRPMARSLLRAGYPLTLHNRSREPVEALCKEGATAATSSREIGAASTAVITMLPSSPNVK